MQVTQTQQSSLTHNGDGECSTTTMSGVNKNLLTNCIVYSPNKYRETEGIKDKGTARNGWNQGRLDEIKNRVIHLDDIESDID